MEDTLIVATPEKQIIPDKTSADTPVGDRDRKSKVQMCVELREYKIKSKKHRNVEVTVLGVKNLPEISGRAPVPFVKLEMNPEGLIFSIELKASVKDKSIYSNVEVFKFPVVEKEDSNRMLTVLVCDRKITRNAKIFGKAEICLNELKIGKPVIQWHELMNYSGEE